MMAGENWWRAYEIGCIQADYRYRSRSATVPVTMPIQPASDEFGVSVKQVAEAHRLVEAYENASAAGDGVVVLDGKLVEVMHVDDAHRTIALWKATTM
jgi:hypothetical protein